jgi:putative endopeptidase
MSEEFAKIYVDTNEHAPGRFRTIGSLQNVGGFAKAFGCKTGNPMAPEKICRVW